ncbi:flagellar protein FlgN [Paenibacillus phocaensis]|uniref:flagellar protein FlgN n=1 Tax=Paenibacillus phocaensis TaxID=1776378 RepID=UPI0003A767A5|nr:flagellar protein FlgN [Paenibacillus phocaensis]
MSVQQVTDVLQRMDELYRTLIELGLEKQKAVMDNDVAGLTQVMTKETRVLKQAAEMDDRRVEAVSQFLKEKGIRSQLNLTITEMTRLVFDPQEKQMLLETQSRLSSTLHELKRLNAINKELVEQSLTFIDYSLNLLTSLPEDEMTYSDPSKQQPTPQKRSYFDTRA